MHAIPSARSRVLTWTVGLRPLAPVVVLAVVAVAAFWPSMSALAELWSDPYRRTYQHGYLVAAIVAWLVYRERHRLAGLPAFPSAMLLAAGLAGSIAWAVAVRAGLQTAHLVLWPPVLWCLIAGVLGWRAGRVILFPIVYLYVAMPIWEPLLPWLQHATVAANRLMIALVGLPAWVEGNGVHLAAGTFVIDVRCSGLSYLVAGLSLAILLGKINQDTIRRRWLLVLLAGGLALVSNWMRVFIVIVAGHLSDMQHYFVRVDHIGLGWVVFGLVFAGFFLVVRRLSDSTAHVPEAPAAMPPPHGAAPAWLLAAAAALAAGPLLLAVAMARDISAAVAIRDVEVSGWTGPWAASGAWHPVFTGVHGESLAEYELDGQRVSAYAGTYTQQEQGRELVGFGNSVHGAPRGSGPGTLRHLNIRTLTTPVPVASGEWVDAHGSRALFWWTYQIGGRLFSRALPAQVWYGIASLVSSPVSSVVVLRSDCIPDCAAAREMLEQFAGAGLPALLLAAGQPVHLDQEFPGPDGTARQP